MYQKFPTIFYKKIDDVQQFGVYNILISTKKLLKAPLTLVA
jgi:hypothetical protein